MGIDSEIKFKRTRKGYDPKDVDNAFDVMQSEIDDLLLQNRELSGAITQYDKKIKQLEDGTRQLEQERPRETRYDSPVWDQDWRQTEAARITLVTMARNLQNISESLLSQVEMLIDEVSKTLPSQSATPVYKLKFGADAVPAACSESAKRTTPNTIYLHPRHAGTM